MGKGINKKRWNANQFVFYDYIKKAMKNALMWCLPILVARFVLVEILPDPIDILVWYTIQILLFSLTIYLFASESISVKKDAKGRTNGKCED
ncbi:MAG: hypothetical protein ACFFCS_19615 [Candidatus Hodarchaeota archaeon]